MTVDNSQGFDIMDLTLANTNRFYESPMIRKHSPVSLVVGLSFWIGATMNYVLALFLAENKKSFISLRGRKGRRFYWNKGKNYLYSHVVWCLHNPTYVIIASDCVHHKNGDQLDDRIHNLGKMTQAQHSKMHHNNRSPEFRQKISENTKRQWQENPPMAMMWDREEAKRLRCGGLSWEKISSLLGMSSSVVGGYFRRNPDELL